MNASSSENDSTSSWSKRQRLQRWLSQRSLDLALQSQIESISEDSRGEEWPHFNMSPAGPLAAWSKTDPSLGEIRLLDSSLTPDHHSPVYVAIIEAHEGSRMVTIVSVSPYLDSASPFEITLQHPTPSVDTLQIWNLRRLPASVLTKSWLVGKLHTDDLTVALTVADSSLAGSYPPDSVKAFCGLPIRHPSDPRRAYLDEQKAILNYLQELGADEYFAEDPQIEGSLDLMRSITRPGGSDLAALIENLNTSGERNQGILSRLRGRFSRVKSSAENELALSATTKNREIIGTLGDTEEFDYIIKSGERGRALVVVTTCREMTTALPLKIGDNTIYLRFEQQPNFWYASEQTELPFSSDLKIQLTTPQ